MRDQIDHTVTSVLGCLYMSGISLTRIYFIPVPVAAMPSIT